MSQQAGQTCHYCPASATTKDHIVSRHTIRRLRQHRSDIPEREWQRFHHLNIVPACDDCNRRKSNTFPTCQCERCRTAALAFHWIALTHDFG